MPGISCHQPEMLYTPEDVAAVLQNGDNADVMGNLGYIKWLAAGQNCILSFAKAAADRKIISSSDGSAIYTSIIDSGGVFARRGSFLEQIGQPWTLLRWPRSSNNNIIRVD